MPITLISSKLNEFAGGSISFSAGNATYGTSYAWNYDDGGAIITGGPELSSTTYRFAYPGVFHVSVSAFGVSAYESNTLTGGVAINPAPDLQFTGNPSDSLLLFYDANGSYYTANTVNNVKYDFGDGSGIISAAPASAVYHQYSSAGQYNAHLSAYDVYGNSSVDTYTVKIFNANNCVTKSEYISTCGPETNRIGLAKRIVITDWLPERLKQSETMYLIQVFEDFLNNMYSGTPGFEAVETVTSPNVTTPSYTYPMAHYSVEQKMGMLDKIKRIADMSDPNLIDINYINMFAANLGYNINIRKGEVGFGMIQSDSPCNSSDNERHIRYMLSELPHWYKIKATHDMFKVMLYSFGLVGDILNYYTKTYSDTNGSDWKIKYQNGISDLIPDDWYPTPHYAIAVNVDNSINYFFDLQESEKVIRAIESVAPVNGVFRGLIGLVSDSADMWVTAIAKLSQCVLIESDGASDYWKT